LRNEVPWIDRQPQEFVRDHIRLTVQPFDGPPTSEHISRVIDQLQSEDLLLFSSDFPHWQFDDDDILPPGFSANLRKKLLVDNPFATYPRLRRIK
jgi:predicted TIM-barrel fold metal-dependent hydrolase